MTSVAILGFGIVGSGVAEVLKSNSSVISIKAGGEVVLKYILDIRSFPDSPYRDIITSDFDRILSDVDVKVIVETMGGSHPAYEYTKAALSAGKSVVTSNKEVVARFGAELLALARENGVNYMFEASVGGGIPIIRPINQCLAANELTSIIAILNGTTNYILTQMKKNNQSYEDALKKAQELGYSERNPAADVEGVDTCRKICILAAHAFGRQIPPERVTVEGITNVKLEHLQYAAAAGLSVKLLGMANKNPDGSVFIRVAPCALSAEHPLSGVEDVYNGIQIKGNAIGDVMFYGKGAGKLPTASAVTADIIDCIKNVSKNIFWTPSDGSFVLDSSRTPLRFFLVTRGVSREDAERAFPSLSGFSGDEERASFISPSITEQELDTAIAKLLKNNAAIDLKIIYVE
ncbi:MAG: homoserine dehydrogenase [Eubacteriales bacterium]